MIDAGRCYRSAVRRRNIIVGLRMDLPAVVAGLTLPYSNGPIEGANTKVILWNQSWSMNGAVDSFGPGVGGSTVRGSCLPGSARSWFGVGPAGLPSVPRLSEAGLAPETLS
jgi:hypothetical protein